LLIGLKSPCLISAAITRWVGDRRASGERESSREREREREIYIYIYVKYINLKSVSITDHAE